MRKPTASRICATRAARAALSATLAASLAFAGFVMAACSPAITNGGANDNEQGATNAAVSDMRINPIDLVTDEDPLKAFAANASMAVLNGQDADGSGGDPESFMEKNLCFPFGRGHAGHGAKPAAHASGRGGHRSAAG